MAGATSATLPLTASASLSGNAYRCKVTNSAGTTTSTAAVLTVSSQPTVTTDPSNGIVFSGQSARLTVNASGTGLSYQWQSATSAAPTVFTNVSGGSGATTSVYTTASLGTGQSGTLYKCRVTNGLSTVDSTTATITVVAAPSIGNDRSTFSGISTSFSVTPVVSGVSYQWKFDAAGSPDSFVDVGTDSSTYSIPNPGTGNRGTYRCDVTNSRGTVPSNAVTLYVHQQLSPTTTVDLGQSGSITVSANGSSLSYQWESAPAGSSSFGNVGTNSSTYSIPATAIADDGRQYRVRVTNTTGTLTSAISVLNVRLDFTRLYGSGSGQFNTFSTCTSCHTDNTSTYGPQGAGGLRFSTASTTDSDESVSYSELLTEVIATNTCSPNGRRVDSFDSAASLFYKRVSGTTCGSQMGNGGGGTLTANDVARIRYWIDKGALQ